MTTHIDAVTRMVNDLLDVSKIRAGRVTYIEEVFDFDPLLREIVESTQQTSLTHTLTVQGAANMQIVGDRCKIGQVLSNLIGNALKYSPQANKVNIEVIPSQERITITIRDYGVGIAEKHHKKIFERFYRASTKKEAGIAGLGMGLHIAYEIVQHYGGDITLASAEGQGSTFMVTLPCTQTKHG